MVPFTVCWKHFPRNKSLVNGVISCGYGLCNFAFGFFAQTIANPLDLAPTIQVCNGKTVDQFYDSQVADNVCSFGVLEFVRFIGPAIDEELCLFVCSSFAF